MILLSIVAPGGSVVQDAGTERTSVYENSIFKTKDDTTSLKAQYEVWFTVTLKK